MKTPKAYYKMEKDAPTPADKKREADLAEALSKEFEKPKEPKRGSYITKTYKLIEEPKKISPKSPMMRYKTGKKQ
jgi:hypothetical protein